MWEREIGGARSEVGNKYVVNDANADAPMKFVPKEKEEEHGRILLSHQRGLRKALTFYIPARRCHSLQVACGIVVTGFHGINYLVI